jgi:hypothetical protein
MNIEKKIENLNQTLLNKRNEIICKIENTKKNLDDENLPIIFFLANEYEIENLEKIENEKRKKIVNEYCENIENIVMEYKTSKQNKNNNYYTLAGIILFFSLIVKFGA